MVSAISTAPSTASETATTASAPAKRSAAASTTASSSKTAVPPKTAVSRTASPPAAAASSTTSGTEAENLLAAVYATTVAGKNYSGSVEESGGEYSASVPNLPGASASGSSVQSAENNLTLVIDTLV